MDETTDLARQLADLHDAIQALPDDAFAERFEFLKRRDKLRDEAAQYAVQIEAQRSDKSLLCELSGLRSQLKALEKQKIDLVSQAGGGPGEGSNMGNWGGVTLNARIMEAGGASQLHARLVVIKGILADRGVEIPKPR